MTFFTKKLALIGVAAATLVGMIGLAAPAQADTPASAWVGFDTASMQRSATAGVVNGYAGEALNVSVSLMYSMAGLSGVATGDVITVNPNITVDSAKASLSTPSIMMTPQIGGSVISAASPWTTTGTLQTLSVNVFAYVRITANTSVTVLPTVTYTHGGTTTTLTPSSSPSVTTTVMGSTSRNSVTASADDSNVMFSSAPLCISTTGLTTGDVLESQLTTNTGSFSNMTSWFSSNGNVGPGGTYTLPALPSGEKVKVTPRVSLSSATSGTTYSLTSLKVVKQGETTDRLTECGAISTPSTVALNSAGTGVTATVDMTAAGSNYTNIGCAAYLTSDTTHSTPIGYGVGGKTSPSATSGVCGINNLADGTYSVGIRVWGFLGASYPMTSETFSTNTITKGTAVVTPAPTTPAKADPTKPSIGSSVKVGKTFKIALKTTGGTKTTGANAQGLVTKVTVASASKAYCSVTPIVDKKKMITGYTVKGLKKSAGAKTCTLTLAITGNSSYNTVSQAFTVTVKK